MIGSPLALLGLLAVAVPVLIHLLGRHRSRIERFPTLRFIGTSRLNPTARRRINDWPLLLVRISIVAAAAFALSQPLFHHAAGTSSDLTRVVIVDTSASVARTVPDTFTGTRVMTASPEDAIPGAVAWLTTRSGRREIAIVSDFQRSSIDTATLASIPRSFGVILSPSIRLGINSARDLLRSRGKQIPRGVYPEANRGAQDDMAVLAGPEDLAGADAAWRAIGLTRPPEPPNTLPRAERGARTSVTLVYRNYPTTDSLLRQTTQIDSLWMARIVASLRRDPALIAAGRNAAVGAAARADLEHITPAIAAGSHNGRLVLFLYEDAGSLLSAALNQALVRAMTPPAPGSELDTTTWSREQLAKFERAPTASPSRTSDASDARWIWALCLALIAFETWMRSRGFGRSGVRPVGTPAPVDEREAAA